jgi:hypothetical protein
VGQKKLDEGIGAVGLLALATALAVLLTAGIPVALAPDPVKVSDWLGFGGSLAGALVALIAAAVAWRAVQKQITAQAEIAAKQMAIQAFDTLVRHVEDLRADYALQAQIRRICMQLYRIANDQLDGRQTHTLSAAKAAFEQERLDLIKAYEEIEHTQGRRWLLPKSGGERYRMEKATLLLIGQLGRFLDVIDMSRIAQVISAEKVAQLREKVPNHNPVIKACEEYAVQLRKAETRVMLQIAKSQMAIGI